MRYESSVTSVSWIPSEAIDSVAVKMPFEMGITRYDAPIPDVIHDLDELRRNGAFRFANRLSAWIEVDNGRIMDHGHTGRGHINSTTAKLGPKQIVFHPTAFSELRSEETGDGWVRFIQTAGGRPGIPAPRRVRKKPFVQWVGPTVWSTLALTIHADGRNEHEVLGASSFPRHWIYDNEGKVVQKSGLIDFKTWYREAFGTHTPWGDEDSAALITEVESGLERELSSHLMRSGTKPQMRKLKAGEVLIEKGQAGDEMFLLLDGVLDVEIDGESIADLGPGAIVGERAALEGGTRTSTLRAATACRVAVVQPDQIEPTAMAELAEGHRREEDLDKTS